MVKTNQTDLIKIASLEKNVSKILTVGRIKPTHNQINIYGNYRNPILEWYLVSIESGLCKESHSVLVQVAKDNVYLFDSNGKTWAKKLKLKATIKRGKSPSISRTVKPTLSPTYSWNASGLCTLWSIVMAIFFTHSGKDSKNKSKFYRYMNKKNNAEKFILDIFTTLIKKGGKNYTTKSEALRFIKEIKSKIQKEVEDPIKQPRAKAKTPRRPLRRPKAKAKPKSAHSTPRQIRRSRRLQRKKSPKRRTRRTPPRRSRRQLKKKLGK
jgi:hypothetical protein